ncbi:dethiobiotin synthase [Aquimarina agarilytica]|uniref:dethiobiotin synthase n=1 Tax=Aquimarina agarilytica TaxID=1087449 RepID=UPI000289E8BC|nr:dethiobiotin synthase [Aquimarina agarilytica]
MQRYFITGIGTEVGKTVVSAIVTEALKADYWKPIQAGDLDFSDTHKVQQWINNKETKFHKNSYALQTPMSPHAAAEIDHIQISAKAIQTPKTTNNLVVEGAGGLLVPINDTETILDLILPTDKVILVSRHYLGSINHSLLSAEVLKAKGITNVGIIFNGNEHKTTEAIILKKTGFPFLGRINEEATINAEIVSKYANQLQQRLAEL